MPLDPGITAQLVQTGGNIPGLIPWNWFAQAGQREHQYQMTDYLYSKDLEQWNRQNEWNLSMWNKQNEYNSPAQQMARYKAAGLNPNLIYGQGSPGLASPMPQAQSPQAKGQAVNNKIDIPPIDFVRVFMDFTRQAQEIKNMEQARQSEAERTQILRTEKMMKFLEANLKPFQIKQILRQIGYEGDFQDKERKLWPIQQQAQEFNNAKILAEIGKLTADALLSDKQREKLETWQDSMKHGINIDKAPWWIQWIYQNFGDVENSLNNQFIE